LVAAKKEKKTAKEIAKFYEQKFKEDLKKLNIKFPDIFVRATETIQDQIKFIQILEKKGFTYVLEDGVYFDTSKLKKYGRLWPREMKILPGARVKMVPGKKNPEDFALWKFAKERKEMVWNSPWGKGFPGWHTECVVMSKKYLGIPFDIHCGGIDHVLIHHTNEIAQSEAAWGKILANYWLHAEFLLVEGKKMAKSFGNIFTLQDLIERGFCPLAFRYFCLGAHYRSKLNFTFEALKSSHNALNSIYEKIKELKETKNQKIRENKIQHYKKTFLDFINDDLNTPKALALMWQVLEEKTLLPKEKYKLLLDFDFVFGLNLAKVKREKIPAEIKELVKKREKLRKLRNFVEADKIREKIKEKGFWVEDTKEGPRIKKLQNF
ncbi:cysteine--tRNA ligase, partial [Candidatus Parcubacteria bacterium]|nr:cysteine--tRNA ligase [Candidatus Parcubacteria bacterium]